MTAANVQIKNNGIFKRIYKDFIEEYNYGTKPRNISEAMISEQAMEMIDPNESNAFWFALAQAQWETCTLDPFVLATVRDIIIEKKDIILWRYHPAAIRKQRQHALDQFLKKISGGRSEAKALGEPENPKSCNCLIDLPSPDDQKILYVTEVKYYCGDLKVIAELNWCNYDIPLFESAYPVPRLQAQWADDQNLVIVYDRQADIIIQKEKLSRSNGRVKVQYVEV